MNSKETAEKFNELMNAISQTEGLKGWMLLLNEACLQIEEEHADEVEEYDPDFMCEISNMTVYTQEWLDDHEEDDE